MKRIGMLTGGGDCPGLNAVIRAVVRRAEKLGGYEILGIKHGWKGLIEKDFIKLDRSQVTGILHRGGTILNTSRTNIFKDEETKEKAFKNIKKMKLDAIITIGGEDTLGAADKLSQAGFNVIGVPKTIDNDLMGTDFTFGFDTAVQIATEAIDRLHTTAESHDRVLVCEVMGRHAGWIATFSGIAGGADVILIPEKPIDLKEVCDVIRSRNKQGRNFSIVVVAEGAKMKLGNEEEMVLSSQKTDEFGHVRLGGIGEVLGRSIEDDTGFETRVTVLGHIQRGGNPTAYDRVLGTKFGVAAMDAAHAGKTGVLVALQGKDVVTTPLSIVSEGIKTVDENLYEMSKNFWA